MVQCSVSDCKNRSVTDKIAANFLGQRMFSFPKDPERKNAWILAVKRKDWTPTPFSRICQAHFEDSAFLRRSSLGRWRLKHNAVPSIFSHSKPLKKRKPPFDRHRTEQELWLKSSTVTADHSYAKSSCPPIEDSNTDLKPIPSSTTEEEDEVIIQDAPEIEIATTIPCNSCSYLRGDKNALTERVRSLEMKLRKLKNAKVAERKKRVSLFKKAKMEFLNEDQIKFLAVKGSKAKTNWLDCTVEKALLLRSHLRSAGYEFLLEQGFPFPSLRTLRRKMEGIPPENSSSSSNPNQEATEVKPKLLSKPKPRAQSAKKKRESKNNKKDPNVDSKKGVKKRLLNVKKKKPKHQGQQGYQQQYEHQYHQHQLLPLVNEIKVEVSIEPTEGMNPGCSFIAK